MDHTRNSTDVVPKGQYMIGTEMAIYLHLRNSLVLHFCNCRLFPKQLDGCLNNNSMYISLWRAMLACLSVDWSTTLALTRDANFRADNNNR